MNYLKILLIITFTLNFINNYEAFELGNNDYSSDIHERLDSITKNLLQSKSSLWNSMPEDLMGHNREELKITQISIDENFKFGFGVRNWYKFDIGRKQYVIGLLENGLSVILFSSNGTVVKNVVLENGKYPISVVTTKRWDPETRQSELVIAYLSNNAEDYSSTIDWYRFVNDDFLQLLWTWKLDKEIIDLQIVEFNQNKQLIVLKKENGRKYKNFLDVYKFSLDDENSYWITQRIPLVNETDKFAINSFIDSVYLSVLQKSSNLVLIFKSNEYNIFELYQTLETPDVQTIESFQLFNKNYLFIGSYDVKIYQIQLNGHLTEAYIEESSFGFNINILPIKTTTFRDDTVLLVEYLLDYDTYNGTIIEVLYYHNGKFKKHEDIPCFYYGVLSSGLGCLVEEETGLGVVGGISLAFRHLNQTRILLPRLNSDSELFVLESQLIPVPNPIQNYIKNFMDVRDQIIALYNEQQHLIKQLQKRLNAKNQIDSSSQTLDVKIQKKQKQKAQIKVDIPKKNEENIEINEFKNQIEQLKKRVKKLQEKSQHAVLKNNSHILFNKPVEYVGGLQVNGNITVKHLKTNNINGYSVDEILKNTIRVDNFNVIKGQKTLTNVSTNEIHFRQLNGFTADTFAYKSQSRIEIHGNVNFTGPVHIQNNLSLLENGKLNNISNFEQNVFQPNRFFDGDLKINSINITNNVTVSNHLNDKPVPANLSEHLEHARDIPENSQIICNTLQVAGKVNVKRVNSLTFDELLKRICLRNRNEIFNGSIVIHGNVFTKSNITVKFLNEQNFNEDFIFANGLEPFTTITGRKQFLGTASALSASVTNTIDNIDIRSLISLTSDEEFLNNFTFDNLEVTEKFKVLGEIIGDSLPKFLPNPSMKETNHIKSNVIFKKLKIDGELLIENTVNQSTWNELLGDVVYKDENTPVISSVKTFQKPIIVENNLEITSNHFNEQNISNLVNKMADEVLHHNYINGIITIENLTLIGHYDGINVTELDQTSVKINGQQYVSSEIIFDQLDPTLYDIFALDLQIIDRINDLTYDQFTALYNETISTKNLTLNDLIVANNVTIFGNFLAESSEFVEENLLSGSREWKNRYLTGNIRNISIQMLNGIPMEKIEALLNNITNYQADLKQGLIPIKEIIVKNGNISTKTINNYNFKQMANNAIYLNKINTNIRNIEFMDDLTVQKLFMENWNLDNLDQLIKDIVLPSENNIYLGGIKTFLNGFHVKENIQTDSINNMKISDIILKSGPQTMVGPLHIMGDLIVDTDLNTTNSLNSLFLSEFENIFRANEDGDIVLKNNGKIVINGSSKMKKLRAMEHINDVHIPTILKNLFYKNGHIIADGTFRFSNKVVFEDNIHILRNYNSITDISKFFENIVTIHNDNHVGRHVIFENNVWIENALKIRHDFNTNFINGVNLSDWKYNAINLKLLKHIPGRRIFESVKIQNDLRVSLLNGKNMTKLITLHTPQVIDEIVEFLQIKTPNIVVENLVNDFNLTEAYAETLTNLSSQVITAPTIFHAPITVENLLLTGPVNNDIDLIKIIPLDTDQELSGQYIFDNKVYLENDMLANSIMGLNLSKLDEKGIHIYGDEIQNITGNWKIHGSVTFRDSVFGNGQIAKMDLKQFVLDKSNSIAQRKYFEETYQQNFQNTCSKLQYLLDSARNQDYMFKHFEILQLIQENFRVESLYHMQTKSKHYLLISYKDLCETVMYEWLPFERRFIQNANFKVSSVKQWITINTNYIVTRSTISEDLNNEHCKHFGTNLWILKEDGIEHKYQLPDVTLLQQSMKVDTFYGLKDNVVYEYNIKNLQQRSNFEAERKWKIQGANVSFIPPSIGMGFALISDRNIIRLHTKNYTDPELVRANYNTNEQETTYTTEQDPNISILPNYYFSPLTTSEIIPIEINLAKNNVGRKFVAVAEHENIQVAGPLDFIKIYENIHNGKLFHKVSTLKPSSLNIMDFDGNGDVFLLFLENGRKIQMYKYKGIEGFVPHSTIKLSGSMLKSIKLPVWNKYNEVVYNNYLLLVNRNTVYVIKAVTAGDKFDMSNLQCSVY